ncbi:PH domain-containing protein [Cellulomonas sp. PhB150]|uniref:PH domain-containing protein n=1 Tax=Cellulomonas sp. PhB150 TaxID=2485188 RepID=UPI000FC20852|nr:PH domain-containing protein [Cellulomonas sp. PhB150]ROS25891.1 putative membrane protein [Cellulomonas sp. PhB150]
MKATDEEIAAETVDATAWRRMHPVTPAIKGWKVLVAVLAVSWYQLGENLREVVNLRDGHVWLWVVGGLAVVALVGFGYSALAWRATRFAVTDDAVHLQTGVLFRQQRQARLDRLQAVDVVQPLLARLVGLAELKLEVAGGSGSAVSLAFLKEADADALRTELLALAAGLRRPQGEQPAARADQPAGADVEPTIDPYAKPTTVLDDQTPLSTTFVDAPERPVYEVPMPRLLIATLRSGAMVAVVVFAIAAVVISVVSRDVGAAFVLVPALLASGGFIWTRVNQGASFRAAISPDGIRLRHGLTESRAQTVPPGRVQAIRLSQSPWWRGPDWWRVEINVAGYGHGEDQARETVLHPVATLDEAMAAVWLVLPDLGVDDPQATLDAALHGRDQDGGFTGSPRSARWVDPIGWRRHGVLVTQRALLARSGRVFRQLDIVPHERTQSLGLAQGPLQRRLGLASFVVHSTPGPVSPSVAHLDGKVAAALLDEQSARARSARAAATPERWMTTEPPA